MIVLTLVVLGIISDFGSYSVSQEYSKIAADQLNDHTDAYKMQNTQSGMNKLMVVISWFVIVFTIFSIIMIWTPKKIRKKVNKKVGKVY